MTLSSDTKRGASARRNGVFLYGYFGAGNLGDTLLLMAALEGLRRVFPGAVFYVRDHGDIRGLEHLGPDVVFTGIEGILADGRRGKLGRFVAYFWAYLGLFRRCRWLVFSGGTVFHERGSTRPLILQLFICLLARACGTRIAAIGVGVGELRTAHARRIVRAIVDLADVFLVRDDAALKEIGGIAGRRTGDLVFGLGPIARPPEGAQGAIGVTVCPPAFSTAAALERAADAMAAAIRAWTVAGRRVVMLVFQQPGVTPGDDAMIARIAAAVGPGIFERRDLPADMAAIADAYADLDAVCGMRFHSLVLAAMVGVPFVGVAHDNKIMDICRRFDMPTVPGTDFTSDDLTSAVTLASSRRPSIEQLDTCVADAAANFSRLSRVVTS
ncbi:MAG TPA: polysaccharide pyruvyl transferase family protein [Alphaproteobacteria bacterium]|nr:polysaccharide pyruvyl transferase family protein [Alphaproteobacteria bacterium]